MINPSLENYVGYVLSVFRDKGKLYEKDFIDTSSPSKDDLRIAADIAKPGQTWSISGEGNYLKDERTLSGRFDGYITKVSFGLRRKLVLEDLFGDRSNFIGKDYLVGLGPVEAYFTVEGPSFKDFYSTGSDSSKFLNYGGNTNVEFEDLRARILAKTSLSEQIDEFVDFTLEHFKKAQVVVFPGSFGNGQQ